MVPNFALSLSFDGIGLLRRALTGWIQIDWVAFEDAALETSLAAMRARATALAPDGAQVLLILPNEQIRFLDLADPGEDGGRPAAVRAALDGATPYAVDELTYDWSLREGRLLAAAVAAETLDEAESFVRAHGFEPVAFTAIPPDGAFEGAVWFGTASGWDGPAPDRLTTPVSIIEASAEAPWAGAALRPEAEPAQPETDADADAPLPPVDASGSQEAPTEEHAEDTQPEAADPAAPEIEAEPASFGGGTFGPGGGARTPPEAPPLPAPRVTVPPSPAVPSETAAASFSSIRATRDVPPPASAPRAPAVRAAADGDPAKRPPLAADDAATSKPAPKPKKTKKKTPQAPAPEVSAAPVPPAEGPEPLQVLAMRRNRGEDPGPATAQLAAAAAAADPEEERRRMTVFGAREQEIGGKPRFLGLMLTAALLLFMAAVAAWASVFLDDGISGLFRSNDESTAIAAAIPVDETPGVTPEAEAADDLTEADPAIGAEAVLEAAALLPDPVSEPTPTPASAAQTLSPEEAAARYAATGIWQRAPTAPREPGADNVDDLYISSVDPAVGQFDAIALPPAPGANTDATLEPLRLPPGPDVRFDLDPRGLVRATPEGAISPDGHRVFTGPPPQVPPQRQSVEDEAAVAAAPPDAAIIATNPLRDSRPRRRPGDLVEQTERVSLGGISVAELAIKRPVRRPASVAGQAPVEAVTEDIAAALEEALEAPAQPSGTARAVASSLEPQTRPGNMSSLVQQAARRDTRQVATASAAPVRIQPGPRVPQNANVAREATTANQINLRDMNLIGVFGSASNRRALVRLSNGRLQNVKVGDRLDGGRVAAIGDAELRLTKGGRNIVLRMPRG